MSLEGDVYKALSAIAPTFPVVAPQGAPLPRLTYLLVSGSDEVSYDADANGATYLRVQIDAWASDFGAAARLSAQAREACYAACAVGELSYNPSEYEVDTKLFRSSFDITIWA